MQTETTVNAIQLKAIFKTAILNRHKILVCGAPGTGKTAIEKQAVSELNFDIDSGALDPAPYGFDGAIDNFVEIASVSDPTDYKGLPAISDGGANFIPIGIMPRLLSATLRTVCFLDEIGQAPVSVQAALMNVVHGGIVSDQVCFLAATNDRAHKAGVTGIIEPLKSRFHAIVNLEPDLTSFKLWAFNNEIDPVFIAWLSFRPEFLCQTDFNVNMQNSSNPRTIEHANDLYLSSYHPDTVFPLLCGAIGQAAASDFMGFAKIQAELPGIDFILSDPGKAPVPAEPSALYAVSVGLAYNATEKNLDALMKYARRLGKEFQTLIVRDMLTRRPLLAKTRGYIDWIGENSDFII